MGCLNRHEVKQIIEMLEYGLDSVPRLNSVEKMKMKSQIRRQDNWLLDTRNPTTNGVYTKLSRRLYDVFNLYPYGFSEKLKEKLGETLAHLDRREVSIPPFMASSQGKMGMLDKAQGRHEARQS